MTTIDLYQASGTSPPALRPLRRPVNIVDIRDDEDLLCRITCLGKRHHFTVADAEEHIDDLARRGCEARYYECSIDCDMPHGAGVHYHVATRRRFR